VSTSGYLFQKNPSHLVSTDELKKLFNIIHITIRQHTLHDGFNGKILLILYPPP
jgi:hypothetical protein